AITPLMKSRLEIGRLSSVPRSMIGSSIASPCRETIYLATQLPCSFTVAQCPKCYIATKKRSNKTRKQLEVWSCPLLEGGAARVLLDSNSFTPSRDRLYSSSCQRIRPELKACGFGPICFPAFEMEHCSGA